MIICAYGELEHDTETEGIGSINLTLTTLS